MVHCTPAVANILVQQALVAQAVLRRTHHSPSHTPVAGVYCTAAEQGSCVFLVEAPYHYTQLGEYLTTTRDADRLLLVRLQSAPLPLCRCPHQVLTQHLFHDDVPSSSKL